MGGLLIYNGYHRSFLGLNELATGCVVCVFSTVDLHLLLLLSFLLCSLWGSESPHGRRKGRVSPRNPRIAFVPTSCPSSEARKHRSRNAFSRDRLVSGRDQEHSFHTCSRHHLLPIWRKATVTGPAEGLLRSFFFPDVIPDLLPAHLEFSACWARTRTSMYTHYKCTQTHACVPIHTYVHSSEYLSTCVCLCTCLHA